MGLFRDTCQAIVDPVTRKALHGDALTRAVGDRGATRCGNKVPKAARFCNKCGAGAPGGWWKCPICGKWVGNESNFCWNCTAALHPEDRGLIASGRWQREAGKLATTIDVGDAGRLLKQGLIVEEGTVALLLDAGAVKDVLEPGRHTLESLARTINWWGAPPPRTVVLVDNGDIAIPLRVTNLRSSEEIPVECYTEICFHFVPKGGADFLANLMKSARELTYEDISSRLEAEVRHAVEKETNTSTVEDLVKDPERRIRLEDSLRLTLGRALERFGLEVVRVASLEFTGAEYEELRRTKGDEEIARRRFEIEHRMRELLSADRMHQFKTEADLDAYVRTLAHEKEIDVENLSHEQALLRLVHRQEIDAKAAEFSMAQELAKLAHGLHLRSLEDGYRREAARLEAENQGAIKLAEAKIEVEITKMWQERKRAKHEEKERHKRAEADRRRGMSLDELLADTEDPEVRKALMAMHALKIKSTLSKDQILALDAASSPHVAEALARMSEAEKRDLEALIALQKKVFDESRERDERMFGKAADTMAEAARHPGSSQQIIK